MGARYMLSGAHRRSMPYRLGPRRYVSRGGCMARISEQDRKIIMFFGWDAFKADDPAATEVAGTGSLLYCGDGRHLGVYLATAAHVAQNFCSDPFVMRA